MGPRFAQGCDARRPGGEKARGQSRCPGLESSAVSVRDFGLQLTTNSPAQERGVVIRLAGQCRNDSLS